MKKNLSIAIFLLLGIFASSENALAETIPLYESYETGGQIEVLDGVGNYVLIGSFESPSVLQLGAGTYIRAVGSGIGAECSGQFYVSSTTDTFVTELWTSASAVYPETETTRTLSTGNPSLTPWLQTGHTYGIWAWFPNCLGGSGVNIVSDALDLIYYGYLSWDGDYGDTFDSLAGITRVVSVSPANASTTATSTSFLLSANVYVNELDYETDTFVRFRYVRKDDLNGTGNPENYYTNIDIPLDSGYGSYYVSTTTSIIESGEYNYYVEIRSPSLVNQILSWWSLGSLYEPQLLARSKTYFIASQRTVLDEWLLDIASTTDSLLADGGLVNENMAKCNPLGTFDMGLCVKGLFLPSSDQMDTFITELKETVLTKAPLGYVTRLVSILTSTATSSLPVVSYTFGSSSPLEGEILSFNFNTTLTEADSILTNDLVSNQSEHKNVWDIIMPLVNVLVYLFVFLLILKDVTGFSLSSKKDKFNKHL